MSLPIKSIFLTLDKIKKLSAEDRWRRVFTTIYKYLHVYCTTVFYLHNVKSEDVTIASVNIPSTSSTNCLLSSSPSPKIHMCAYCVCECSQYGFSRCHVPQTQLQLQRKFSNFWSFRLYDHDMTHVKICIWPLTPSGGQTHYRSDPKLSGITFDVKRNKCAEFHVNPTRTFSRVNWSPQSFEFRNECESISNQLQTPTLEAMPYAICIPHLLLI